MRYAERHGLEITRWFEERESASKKGRHAFDEMLRLLRLRVAGGVIIHKIDRSARNLEDWTDIGKLADAGVDVHFATESVDLTTTAGRLSADIQAVVATHYSRNLREEVKKGLYGRLKQGFFPLRAPVGYLDQGAAKPKIHDPIRAPLVKTAFELYATGEYSLPSLTKEMFQQGLRNRNDARMTIGGLARMLKNSFYIGLMPVRGRTYQGVHEPLVAVQLFETVQAVLSGKRVDRIGHHSFTYSRLARCATCGYSLIAERRKGHIYYRCHNRPFKNPPVCPTTSVREEQIEAAVLNALEDLELSDQELAFAKNHLAQLSADEQQRYAETVSALHLQRDQVQHRISQLIDLLIDGTVAKPLYEAKNKSLLVELAAVDQKLSQTDKAGASVMEQLTKTVELAKSAYLLYKAANTPNKRKLLKTVLSNLIVSGKNVEITLAPAFHIIAERKKQQLGGPNRDTCRTWEEKITALKKYLWDHPLANQEE